MSFIFQLFSAKDLENLNTDQLEELKQEAGNPFYPTIEMLQVPAVQIRAREVYDQFETGVPNSREYKQIWTDLVKLAVFTEEQLNVLSDDQLTILEWAIVCEVAHSDEVLSVVKEKTVEVFRRYSNNDIIGSDAFYQHEP